MKSDDGTVAPDNPVHKFTNVSVFTQNISFNSIVYGKWLAFNKNQFFKQAGEITGQPFDLTPTMKGDIEAAGFSNIHEKLYKAPFGCWPADPKLKEIGKWTLLGFDVGLEGNALATMTRVIGVSFLPSNHLTLLQFELRGLTIDQWSPNEVHVLL